MMTPRQSGPSTTSRDPAVVATEELARVLDRFGDALVDVNAAALLAVQGELDGAVAAMSVVTTVGDHAAARAATGHALQALLRCRRLGASFSDAARALGRVGRSDGYDRAGGYVERAIHSSVQVRA
jgi:hypothetical protein